MYKYLYSDLYGSDRFQFRLRNPAFITRNGLLFIPTYVPGHLGGFAEPFAANATHSRLI